MTVPQGAKIIRNRFDSRCKCGCKSLVPTGVGAAILDPNVNGGKWATFQPEHLPSPYEEDDIPDGVHLTGTFGHRRYTGPVTPEHQRCANPSCGHWRVDHGMAGCVGRPFPGAPVSTCTCPGFVEPSVVTTYPAPFLAPAVQRTATHLATLTPAQVQAEIDKRIEREKEQTLRDAISLAPTTGVAPTIVCFYGPIKSASDGQQHFIYPQDLAHLHGIDTDTMSATRVLFVSPEQKQAWRPPTVGDYYVIGPHFTKDEYDQAKAALHEWLEEKGVI